MAYKETFKEINLIYLPIEMWTEVCSFLPERSYYIIKDILPEIPHLCWKNFSLPKVEKRFYSPMSSSVSTCISLPNCVNIGCAYNTLIYYCIPMNRIILVKRGYEYHNISCIHITEFHKRIFGDKRYYVDYWTKILLRKEWINWINNNKEWFHYSVNKYLA